MAKVTLSTVKSFIKKNIHNLTVVQHSSFDGMHDCVMPNKFEYKVDPSNLDMTNKNTFGMGNGVWFVGNSRDYITQLPNGFEIYNCCGTFELLVK